MASADVTLASEVHEFEVDATQRTATLNQRGGWIRNVHATEPLFVNMRAATVTVATPAGIAGATLRAGQSMKIPAHVTAFTFDAANATALLYSPEPLM